MAFQLLATSLPDAEEIQRVAREVVARGHYQLDSPARSDSPPLLFQLLRAILEPFFWLFDALEGLPEALRWLIVVGLGVLCAALIAHIVYSFVRAVRGMALPGGRYHAARELSPDPETLEREAAANAGKGDYIGAIRTLFRAGLLRIEAMQQRRFPPGFTNRHLLRRFRSTALGDPLHWFVRTIDLKWYGGQACDEGDFQAGQAEYARIRTHLQERTNAHAT